MTPELAVLYEDNHCLAVAKPAPLLTQARPACRRWRQWSKPISKIAIINRATSTSASRTGSTGRCRVWWCSRNTKAARRLAEQFAQRQVRKVYWAVVEPNAEGGLPPEEGVWEDWLLKIREEARTERVPAETPGAKLAVLRFRRLSCTADGALVEIEPETGRMHQIRVQAATRGWPVRGDFLYGARLPFGPIAELPRDRIIALHARSLTFLHPIRFEPLTVTAPLPEVWRPWAPATPISP